MVGGFSESALVQQAMRERFETNDRKVLVPVESELCVLKGAVIFGHQPKCIRARVLRYSYGIETEPKFRQGIHDPENKSTVDGIDYCSHVFSMLVSAGTQIVNGEIIRQIFRYPTSLYETASFSVFVSFEDSPMYTTDSSCRLLAREYYRNMVRKVDTVDHKFDAVYVFGETEMNIFLEFETGEVYQMNCELD